MRRVGGQGLDFIPCVAAVRALEEGRRGAPGIDDSRFSGPAGLDVPYLIDGIVASLGESWIFLRLPPSRAEVMAPLDLRPPNGIVDTSENRSIFSCVVGHVEYVRPVMVRTGHRPVSASLVGGG